jgi:hypothetical protein
MKTKQCEHPIILNRYLNINSRPCALNTEHTFKFSLSMPEMWDRGTECSKSVYCPHHENIQSSRGTAPHIINSAMDGIKWSASRSNHIPPGKTTGTL